MAIGAGTGSSTFTRRIDPGPGSNEEAVDRDALCQGVFSAIVSAGLLGGVCNVIPAKSRWGTCAQALASQMCGCLCHSVLPRALKRAFGNMFARQLAESEVADDGDDNFRKVLRSKIARSIAWTGNQAKLKFRVAVSLVSEHLDHLLMVMQQGSDAGGVLVAMLADTASPFRQAQRAFFDFLTQPVSSTSLGLVFSHFGRAAEDAE